MTERLETLWRGFVDPPDEARPRAWWHWMDGNVDPAGIVLDLEWLHRVGVRGVQLFDGGMGTPLVVPERVEYGSPEWGDAVRLAATTARRLGMEFTVATSAGWSAAGGPWVEPADAMRKLVWSETLVSGGATVSVALAALPDVAGPIQDLPRWGADSDRHRSVREWVTLAIPADPAQKPLQPASMTASGPLDDWGPLVDGRSAVTVSLPRDPDATSSAWIEQVFDASVSVGAVTVALPGPRGFGAAPPPHAVLEVSDDGVAYRFVAELPVSPVPVQTAAFAPVTGSRFRLTLTGGSAADALPRLAEGVRLPPVLRRSDAFLVGEFALAPGGRVHQAELKAGFGAALDYHVLDGPDSGSAIDPARVLDVSSFVGPDGVLQWDAPEGEWRILRFGASLTGQTNGPASPAATGLEVDKLDGDAVRRYFDHSLALFDAALEPDPAARIDALLSDSIESGPQNATARLLEGFTALRGYDPLPWLPALAGYVVGSPADSDRFLFDHRRTIADLIASEYYGTVEAVAHERELTYYAEALEDHRPQLGDDLAMRAHADVPMGAMWLFDAGVETAKPTYIADLRGASSVAHVYGKAFTGAESMSAFHRPWSYTPRRLKHIADLELALGVTLFCLHTSPHQPTQVPPPGIGLAPFLGQAFIRSEPWAELAGPWMDYLARCSFVLNQGVPAVDVAVFAGEEGPLTALYGDAVDRSVPPGIGFDYVGLDALEQRLVADDGLLAAGDVRYRVLFLGGSSERMTLRALHRIAQLAEQGAVVVGARPTGSPSLADDPAEYVRFCDALWGGPTPLVDAGPLADVLRALGVRPSHRVEGAALLSIARRLDGTSVTFLANPSPDPVSVLVHADGPVDAWDPVTLRREGLPESEGDERAFRLDLAGCGSVLLVDGGASSAVRGAAPLAEFPIVGDWRLELPGRDPVPLPDGPRPWTDLGAADFAGVGSYSTAFESGTVEGRCVLALGEVGDLARVRVNGIDCGIAWTAPFELDVTHALVTGRNEVRVEVANAWMNRLIAEARVPTGELFAPVAAVYEPHAPIATAGLSGPVVLRHFA